MKRNLAFKSRKYTAKGLFFLFWFIKKIVTSVYYFIKNLVHEAKSGKGECPKCKSLDIVYEKPIFLQHKHKFNCTKCNATGNETYSVVYNNSDLIKEK